MRNIYLIGLVVIAQSASAEPIAVNAEPIALAASETYVGSNYFVPILITVSNGEFLTPFSLRSGNAVPSPDWALSSVRLEEPNVISLLIDNVRCRAHGCVIQTGNLLEIPAHGLRFASGIGTTAEIEIRVPRFSSPGDAIPPQRRTVATTTIDLVTTPQTGWWWNPAEPGRGFFIERQADQMFVAAYVYDDSGAPTWLVAQGSANSRNVFSADLLAFEGGQTLAGDFMDASISEATGKLELEFVSDTSATMRWPGGEMTIERFNFGSIRAIEPLDPLIDTSLPEDGWYWDPDQPGTGFSVEIQRNSVFLAGYLYNDEGGPVWYTAQGNLSNSAIEVELLEFENGQPIGASHRLPNLRESRSLLFDFSAPDMVILDLNGERVVELERFTF